LQNLLRIGLYRNHHGTVSTNTIRHKASDWSSYRDVGQPASQTLQDSETNGNSLFWN
jgi:hypothetical protein